MSTTGRTSVEYLEAHTDADAKLTPTLAHAHPDLVEEYGAFDWSCPRCDNTYARGMPWIGAAIRRTRPSVRTASITEIC